MQLACDLPRLRPSHNSWHVDKMLSFFLICFSKFITKAKTHTLCMLDVTREWDLSIDIERPHYIPFILLEKESFPRVKPSTNLSTPFLPPLLHPWESVRISIQLQLVQCSGINSAQPAGTQLIHLLKRARC